MPRPRKVSNEELLAVVMELNESDADYSSESIGDRLSLSRPTVNRRLKEMDGEDWIRVTSFRDDFGHRRYTVRVLAKGRKKVESWQKKQAKKSKAA